MHTMQPKAAKNQPVLLSIGGGNMATAIIGGLLRSGFPAQNVWIADPSEEKRGKLQQQFTGVRTIANTAQLPEAAQTAGGGVQVSVVLWAVKPQVLQQVAQQAQPALAAYAADALHISVAAGVTTHALAQWTNSMRLVRAMPNTPALVGQGMTGLFATSAVSADSQLLVEQVLGGTGQLLWVQEEAQIDVVTALSGSGPAYVFYFLQAMVEAGVEMGMDAAQARTLAQATFAGATALAQQSTDELPALRANVTSKGGTTHAAITCMEDRAVRQHIQQALLACRDRAQELGEELSKPFDNQ